jgi:hypothetical protein
MVSEGGVRLSLDCFFERRHSSKGIVAIALHRFPKLFLCAVPEHIRIFIDINVWIRLITEQLPLLILGEQVAEKVCVGTKQENVGLDKITFQKRVP